MHWKSWRWNEWTLAVMAVLDLLWLLMGTGDV